MRVKRKNVRNFEETSRRFDLENQTCFDRTCGTLAYSPATFRARGFFFSGAGGSFSGDEGNSGETVSGLS